MKKAHLILLAIVFIVFSCKKEDKSCGTTVTYEISSTTPATIDSVKFLLVERGPENNTPNVSRFLTNLSLPYVEDWFTCGDLEYNLRCYDSDTSLVLTLKIYKDGVLRDQIVSSPNDSVVLSGGF